MLYQDKIPCFPCALSLFPFLNRQKKNKKNKQTFQFVNSLYHPYSHPFLHFIINYYMLKWHCDKMVHIMNHKKFHNIYEAANVNLSYLRLQAHSFFNSKFSVLVVNSLCKTCF